MRSTFISLPKRSAANRRRPLPREARVVVVGNGMVGCHFCEQMLENFDLSKLHLTVVGAEPLPAYDRVRLSSYVDHKSPDHLLLRSREWYEENDIQLLTGDPITKIHRESQEVRTTSGKCLAYDVLILATGSRPFLPPIPGLDHPDVHVYRTINDLSAIVADAKGKTSATIIGGGLLGLEAAQAVQKLELNAHIVERAEFLMPQQLNETASRLLEAKIRDQDIELHLGMNTQEVRKQTDGFELQFAHGEPLSSDLLIVSAGIQPNSELAAEADLPCGLRGGIIVNDFLETEDPSILAIGECALHKGRIYGLVAPGYQMAAFAAKRLRGRQTRPFPIPDLSTRLKMLGIDVVTIGDSLQEGRLIEFSSDDTYRALTLGGKGEINGGLGVGPWPEAGRIQTLRNEGAVIKPREESYFTREGVLSPAEAESSVSHWPDERLVCNCRQITKGELVSALPKCNSDPDQLAACTGASSVCGSCQPLLAELCGNPPTTTSPTGFRGLLAFSSIALLGVLATLIAPPVGMAESVQSWWYQVDQLWRNGVFKQVSGFTLLGITLLGLLLSLRKRFRWFRFGHFAKWRVFHAVFGVIALIGLFAHTGFRFGHNLNFWLMFSFVGLNLLGAAAGVVSALESRGTSGCALIARRFRPVLTYSHLVLFWPLPVLLTFHILSVYIY